jgi:hypothetical protein
MPNRANGLFCQFLSRLLVAFREGRNGPRATSGAPGLFLIRIKCHCVLSSKRSAAALAAKQDPLEGSQADIRSASNANECWRRTKMIEL